MNTMLKNAWFTRTSKEAKIAKQFARSVKAKSEHSFGQETVKAPVKTIEEDE